MSSSDLKTTRRRRWRSLRCVLSWRQWERRNWSAWQSMREHVMPHQWWEHS